MLGELVMLHPIFRILTASALLVSLAGCGTLHHLNDPGRSRQGLDVANLLPPRDIPYETVEKNGIAISHNLFFAKSDSFSGYRLTLIFRNTGTAPRIVKPRISMRDSNGFIVLPYDYDAFVAEAASLAGTEVPPIPPEPQPTLHFHSGTISSSYTGNTYAHSGATSYSGTSSYSGTTVSVPAGGFASGFARGLAQGAAIRAMRDRAEGRLLVRWANAFWLRGAYELPAGAAASGALFFPASQIGQLPLRLVVEAGSEQFEFTTIAKL